MIVGNISIADFSLKYLLFIQKKRQENQQKTYDDHRANRLSELRSMMGSDTTAHRLQAHYCL